LFPCFRAFKDVKEVMQVQPELIGVKNENGGAALVSRLRLQTN
jgi:hypothetical protein